MLPKDVISNVEHICVRISKKDEYAKGHLQTYGMKS